MSERDEMLYAVEVLKGVNEGNSNRENANVLSLPAGRELQCRPGEDGGERMFVPRT